MTLFWRFVNWIAPKIDNWLKRKSGERPDQ
jgi:hypothetical protein